MPKTHGYPKLAEGKTESNHIYLVNPQKAQELAIPGISRHWDTGAKM